MPVGYTIYAEVLRTRLEEQLEEKGSIPKNQTGFRKGMGTIDNIYTRNYLFNRNLGMKKGKLIALFVDFTAAFDSGNRRVLWKKMRERGVNEGLIQRINEIFVETRIRVSIGEQRGEVFWIDRELRQGCPLSPLLFSILLADLEERMGWRGKGGTGLENGRIYLLAYADDVLLVAVNVSITKVMCFRKRKKKIEYEWRIAGEEVELMERFCYLGCNIVFIC